MTHKELMTQEKELKCGTNVRDKQAKAELSTEPLSNHALTMAPGVHNEVDSGRKGGA